MLFAPIRIALSGLLGVALASAQNELVVSDSTPPSAQTLPRQLKAEKVVSPPISEIARIDETAAFFLDTLGQIGVAKFSDTLELVGWDMYSTLRWQEARHMAVGRNLSIVSGSSNELTQAFDTDKDGRLDFFQDTISEWPGKAEGATISCGPVADQYGRLLFAVAPRPGTSDKVPPSTLFAWNPGGQTLTTLATSSLPIAEMAVSKDGLLAAWIQLPSYSEGYFISFAQLPSFDRKKPDEQPANPPTLLPDLIIPTSMTSLRNVGSNGAPIGQFCFTYENKVQKLLITCPAASRLIEMTPKKNKKGWEGSITVRETFPEPIYAIEPMAQGKVLLGGKRGFLPLGKNLNAFRISEINVSATAVEIDFTQPIDRAMATSESGIQLSIIPLEGTLEPFEAPDAVVEPHGRTLLLDLPKLPGKAIIKIEAEGLSSEEGEPIVYPAVFYQLN